MPYTVTIKNTNISFQCDKGQSILDAAHQANILISYSCKGGLCGSCEAVIKEGEVAYPDGKPKSLTLEDIDNNKAILCKGVAKSDLMIEARIEKPETQRKVRTLPVKVKQKNLLSDDVMQLLLQLPTTEETFDFLPGQWLYFVMKDGKKRAFSIANTVNEDKIIELHIRHADGGVFTEFVFNKLKEGDILKIEGPHGTFFYHDDFREIIMVAGGTGFAPLKGILQDIVKQDNVPAIHLYWGVRSKKDLYMEDQVKQWLDEKLIKYTPVLSDPQPEDNWNGATGFVHEAILNDFELLKDYVFYMAGPPQMITASKKSFMEKKAKSKHIYFDSFDYSEDATQSKDSN